MDLLKRLEAIEDIKNLRARYGRAVDTQDWDTVAASWAHDGTFERGVIAWKSDNPLPTATAFHGKDAIVAMIRQAGKGLFYIHHVFMPEIEITSESTARGTWAASSISRKADDLSVIVIEVAGYYHETYERLEQGWVIKSIVPQRLYVNTP